VIVYDDGSQEYELAKALQAMGNGEDLLLTPDQELPETMGGFTEYPVYITLPP
jgi:hypothetical protein